MVFLLVLWRLVIGLQVFFYSGWIEYFGGQGMYWILFNLGSVNQWFQYNNLKVFLGLCSPEDGRNDARNMLVQKW